MVKYITTDAATLVTTGYISKVLIQVNAALTGSIKVIDGITGTTANVATITNPTVGSQYEYWDLKTGLIVIASGSCDISVSASSSFGPK